MNEKQKFVCLALAAPAVFGAGEEISWGQRIFDIQSPEFFEIHNAQRETTIHNMHVPGIEFNKLVFAKGMLIVFLIYLGVLTPLYHRKPKYRQMINGWGIPIPRSYHVAGYLITIVLVEGLIFTFSEEANRRGELTEFMSPC